MNQPPPLPGSQPSQRFLFAWAVIASLAAVVFAAIALFLYLRPQESEGLSTSTNTMDKGQEDVAQLPVETRDFSTSNVVSILLGKDDAGDGVRHLDRERDGPTTVATLEGVPCRYLHRKPQNKSMAYMYFVVHPTFKAAEMKRATVEVEYFDGVSGVFGLHYDAIESPGNRAYVEANRLVRLRGSNVWQTATFQLKEPSFANSQNGGADFRLWVSPPELYVRRVSVIRGSDQNLSREGR
jgi:hypothetical protein